MGAKLKGLLLSGLGILAALAVGVSIVLYLQLDSAREVITTQAGSIQRLNIVNETNQTVLRNMREDFTKLNTSIQDLNSIRDDIERRQTEIRALLRKLGQNDEEIKAFLNCKLPASVGRMFTGSSPASGSGTQDTGKPAAPAKGN